MLRGKRVLSQLLAALLVACSVSTGQALTSYYYVDPNWTGAHTGSASEPWNAFGPNEWSAVNTALANGDVIVYATARAAASDTEVSLGNILDITGKTTDTLYTFTFDGYNVYNTSEVTPSWSPYAGNNRFRLQAINSDSVSHTKYNRWTIQGVKVVQEGNGSTLGAVVSICGDHVTIKDSNISAASSTVDGPGILLIPTADAAHEGAAHYCPASTDINIRNNTIHDTYSEPIYLGGGGCQDLATPSDKKAFNVGNGACQGAPAHTFVTVHNNTVYACASKTTTGTFSGCLTMKAALQNVTIDQNEFSNESNGHVEACIAIQGTTTANSGGGLGRVNQFLVFERNHLLNCPNGAVEDFGYAGVAIANTWGTPNGIEVLNNVIENITATTGTPECVIVHDAQSDGVQLYSNTLYNCASTGIRTYADTYNGTVTAINNAVLSVSGLAANLGATMISHANIYDSGWTGTCSSACAFGLASSDFTNVSLHNFLPSPTSALRGVGVPLTTFSNDYAGVTRTVPWDVGAYKAQ